VDGGSKSSGFGQRVGVSLAGAGAFYALIQLLQNQLGAFHLQPWVERLMTLTVAVLGLLITQMRAVHQDDVAERQRSAALDTGMASFTPRRVGELSGVDLGVRFAGGEPGTYVERDADEELAEAFENVGSVVVVGPARCGKTRTALQVAQRDDEAVLLVPEHATGLAAILTPEARDIVRRQAFAAGSEPVLWLDNLERFIDGLDLDALDQFQRPGLLARAPRRRPAWTRRRPGWMRRPPGWTRRRQPPEAAGTREAAAARGAAGTPEGAGTEAADLARPKVRLLATIRQDQLELLLDGGDERSRTGRRLLARLQGIALSDTWSVTERARFRAAHAGGHPAPTISATFPDRAAPGWAPGVAWTHKEPERRRFTAHIVTGVLVLTTIGLALATVIVGHRQGWTIPPPIPAQIASIEAGLEPCQHAVRAPSKGLGPNRSLVLIVHSAACPGPDQLRFYADIDGRLSRRFVETPSNQTEAWRMFCVGAGRDACHVPVGYGVLVPVVVEAPTDSQLLPLVIYTKTGDTRTRALFLPRPPRLPDPDAGVERRLLAVPLAPGAPADADSVAPLRCRLPGTLCGYPAEAVIVAPPASGRHPALLVAGYLSAGSATAPQELIVRAWEITVPEPGDVVVGRRPCLVFEYALIRAKVPIVSGELPGVALRQWLARSSTTVVC
jgi:hypothetical protein